ncbi:MFS transporter [Kocuria tytonicola]|uniref:MFS transporter n=1 Tax=Kocuria tytonicola TaxID=2055946 RepID=A0A3L9L6B0_9MICC|nr:MFS transporter [Kocuria tytonicola]RLY94225.1 MFS transporter [Kocuria tytonicola]
MTGEHSRTAPQHPPRPGAHPETAPDAPAQGGSRARVLMWCLWDTGTSAYNSVMLTFVFTVYLTSSAFGTPEYTSTVLSAAMAVAGFVIALTAPIVGQRGDTPRSRARFLTVNSWVLVLCTGLAFLTRPEPAYLYLGVGLVAVGSVAQEFATVGYNSMLPALAGPARMGKVSGWGWGAGYVGGIFALAFVLFGFVTPGFLGIPTDDALNYRAVALFSAVWILVFCLPLMVTARSMPFRSYDGAVHGPSPAATPTLGGLAGPPLPAPEAPAHRGGILGAYRELFATIASLWRVSRATVFFLLSSAVYRDGLAGVFTFGGVLAAGTFGFSLTEVIVFAVAANLIAALGAFVGGALDDALGPRAVITGSLVGIMVAGVVLLFWTGKPAFWVCGLALCLFVGPAQAASRTYLGRLIPPGRDGEIYGLYATTGRAVSFMAPGLFGLFVSLLGAQIWGILGILVVVGVGLALLLLTPRPPEGLTTTRV